MTSPKESCFADIKLRILTTDLEPGAMLDEATLAAHYGLSRTPLREVLQRLSGAGYTAIIDNRGAKVASMDIATMRMFFQTAPMVYANISRLAAHNRTAAQLADLQNAQAEFAKQTLAQDVAAVALANHRFHAVIGEMARNPYLSASLDRLLIDHTRLSRRFYDARSDADAARIRTASAQHDALISAIEAQDSALAVDLTLRHWDLSKDRIEHYVRPDPLPVDLFSEQDVSHAV